MENESTSTWAFLNKSGEIVNVEADPGSSSESSIEFIHDEIVHYERNNNHRSSLQPEVQEDSEDVAENSSEVLSLDGATVVDNVSTVKDEEGGEGNRSELTLENITFTDNNASVSPNSTSPVSPSSSDDSSGSVTLLEGRFSDGDSDFELLDQHSSSDLAHLQLAAGVSNALPATHRPKFNFKLKKQVPSFSAMGISETETESVNVSDADDESSNNVELCSSIEESEIASVGPVDEIPPVTNLGSLAPVPPHLPVPTLALKPPRMSVTFLMLASLVIGLLLGITTKYSLDPYSSEQLSEDIAEMQRINEMHLLREENDHMRKYVDSLKWRMNNLQNSNKQLLSDELRQVNQLLKGRIEELDQQILTVRHEILEAKSGVQPPTVSDTGNQHLPADNLQVVSEPTSNNDPELQIDISNHVGAASHDDIIQIHSSPEELAQEESHGNSEQISSPSVSLVGIPNNDALSISSDEIIKSENKADDTIAILQLKLEEEKKRADNLEKLYAELKQLIDSRKLATDSSALLTGSSVETLQGAKVKKVKESVKYCSPLDKDCSMDWLNQDVMLHLISSVMAEIPPQAQQWKEYMTQKFQSILDPQIQQEPSKELEDESEINSNFQLKKLNVYMNRMLDQINRAKDDLQNKFEKTLHKIKKGTSKFWEKTVSKNEKEMKKLKERKKDQELVDIEDSEGSQDSRLQLITESNYLEAVDANKEYKSLKIEKFGLLQKGLKVAEIDQDKHKFDNDDDKIRSNDNKRHQHHRPDDRKKPHLHKSNYKDKKYGPQKSDHEDKKYQSHKSHSEEKKHQYKNDIKHWSHKSDDDQKNRPHKLDSEDKKQRYDDDKYQPAKLDDDDDDDIKHWSHKSDKKHRPHKSDDDKKHRPHKSDDDKKHRPHKSDKKHRPHKSDKKHRLHKSDDDKKHRPHKSDDDKKHRLHKSDDDKKHRPRKFDKKHRLHKLDNEDKKQQYDDDDDDDDTKHMPHKLDDHKSFVTEKKWSHSSNDEKNHLKKKKSHHSGTKIIDSASHEKKNKRKAKEYRDNKKLLKDQNNFKKTYKKYKDDFEIKAQSKESCDQLAVKLEDSISTISKEKFRRMNLKTILRISKKLSNFNKQCKHFSSNSVKEWSACQQMWWTLCGQQGFLPGQLQNFKCQHCLLGWQLLAAASPDGGGKSGCDDCGCQNKAGKQKEDRQNATDSDSAFENMKEEEKKVMSGEWYFKHKSVPAEKSGEWYFKHKSVPAEKSGEWYFKPKSVSAENNEQDCDENDFQCVSTDLWDEMENDKLQHLDKMLNAEFHRLNHYSHMHRRRCRDYSNHVNCYSWFHPMYVGKWASVYYQNLMNIMQKWQK